MTHQPRPTRFQKTESLLEDVAEELVDEQPIEILIEPTDTGELDEVTEPHEVRIRYELLHNDLFTTYTTESGAEQIYSLRELLPEEAQAEFSEVIGRLNGGEDQVELMVRDSNLDTPDSEAYHLTTFLRQPDGTIESLYELVLREKDLELLEPTIATAQELPLGNEDTSLVASEKPVEESLTISAEVFDAEFETLTLPEAIDNQGSSTETTEYHQRIDEPLLESSNQQDKRRELDQLVDEFQPKSLYLEQPKLIQEAVIQQEIGDTRGEEQTPDQISPDLMKTHEEVTIAAQKPAEETRGGSQESTRRSSDRFESSLVPSIPDQIITTVGPERGLVILFERPRAQTAHGESIIQSIDRGTKERGHQLTEESSSEPKNTLEKSQTTATSSVREEVQEQPVRGEVVPPPSPTQPRINRAAHPKFVKPIRPAEPARAELRSPGSKLEHQPSPVMTEEMRTSEPRAQEIIEQLDQTQQESGLELDRSQTQEVVRKETEQARSEPDGSLPNQEVTRKNQANQEYRELQEARHVVNEWLNDFVINSASPETGQSVEHFLESLRQPAAGSQADQNLVTSTADSFFVEISETGRVQLRSQEQARLAEVEAA